MPTSTTIGRILDKSISREEGTEDTYYRPAISYEYTVNGVLYSSDQVTSWQIATGSKQFSERVLARYRVGARVTVTYDVENPAKAYLEQGAGGAFAISPGGVGCLILMVFVGVLVVFNPAGLEGALAQGADFARDLAQGIAEVFNEIGKVAR